MGNVKYKGFPNFQSVVTIGVRNMRPFVFSASVLVQVSPPPTPPPEGDSAIFRVAKNGSDLHF
jgi:hypothetical protein